MTGRGCNCRESRSGWLGGRPVIPDSGPARARVGADRAMAWALAEGASGRVQVWVGAAPVKVAEAAMVLARGGSGVVLTTHTGLVTEPLEGLARVPAQEVPVTVPVPPVLAATLGSAAGRAPALARWVRVMDRAHRAMVDLEVLETAHFALAMTRFLPAFFAR
jgi:hypothetical protein